MENHDVNEEKAIKYFNKICFKWRTQDGCQPKPGYTVLAKIKNGGRGNPVQYEIGIPGDEVHPSFKKPLDLKFKAVYTDENGETFETNEWTFSFKIEDVQKAIDKNILYVSFCISDVPSENKAINGSTKIIIEAGAPVEGNWPF